MRPEPSTLPLLFGIVALASTAGCTEILALDFDFVDGGGGGAGGDATTSLGGDGLGGDGGGGASGGVTNTGGAHEGGAMHSACTTGDEFSGTAPGACWEAPMIPGLPQDFEVAVAGGELSILPHVSGESTTWHGLDRGYLLYREISGEFALVTHVRATEPGLSGAPSVGAGDSYHMAGVVVLDPEAAWPASPGPDMYRAQWVKFEVGYRQMGLLGAPEPVGILVGATQNDTTAHVTPYDATVAHELDLGICRASNNRMHFFYRQEGQAFVEHGANSEILNQFQLGETLRVGVTALAFAGIPSVDGHFDFVRFAEHALDPTIEIGDASDCAALLEGLADGTPARPCGCE